MTVVYESLLFATLAMTAMSLLTLGIITQNANATTSEIRMLANLNPANAGMGDGRADYRERGLSMRLNVEVEDVTPNSTLAIEVSGNPLGTITTNSFGIAESISQGGNVTVSSDNNNTSVSPIEEEQPPALLSPSQQQQHQQQNQTVSIILDSSTLIDNPGFQPSQIQAQVGDTVTWINDDLQPHTVTSGSNGVPDNKFNSSPNFIPLMTPGGTFSHTFTEAGEYPYFCLLHPNMVGTVSVMS
jgi:plastocyanin